MSAATRLMVFGKKAHTALYRRFDTKALRTIKGQPILLLTVAGRKSGTPHTTPVVYLPHEGGYVVAGSAGGAPQEPQWFKNLRATTTAHVEVGDAHHEVGVRVLEGTEYDAAWTSLVDTAPFFDGYRTKSGRQIPLALLSPTT